jgi:hypothetical protein
MPCADQSDQPSPDESLSLHDRICMRSLHVATVSMITSFTSDRGSRGRSLYVSEVCIICCIPILPSHPQAEFDLNIQGTELYSSSASSPSLLPLLFPIVIPALHSHIHIPCFQPFPSSSAIHRLLPYAMVRWNNHGKKFGIYSCRSQVF